MPAAGAGRMDEEYSDEEPAPRVDTSGYENESREERESRRKRDEVSGLVSWALSLASGHNSQVV